MPPAQRLDRCFGALAHPVRRAIVERLAHGDATVTTLADPFPMSLPAVSKHLKVLEDAGLVARERRGRTHHCRLVMDPMTEATNWLARTRRFWEPRLDALERYLEEEEDDA